MEIGGRKDKEEEDEEEGGQITLETTGIDGLVYVYRDSIQDLFCFVNTPSNAPQPGCISLSLRTAAIALITVAKRSGCSTFLTFSDIIFPAIRAVIVVPPG